MIERERSHEMDRARWVKLGFADSHGNPDISHDILQQERVCMNTTFLQHGGYHMLTPEFHFCVMEHKATESTPGLLETLIIKPRVFSSRQLVLIGICHLSWPLGRRGYGQVRISQHKAWNLHMHAKPWVLPVSSACTLRGEEKEQEAMCGQLLSLLSCFKKIASPCTVTIAHLSQQAY